MTPLLSILILTIRDREKIFRSLMGELERQRTPQIEVLTQCEVKGGRTRGAARQSLLMQSAGDYACFIDDDDKVHPRYCELILDALATKPDCIGFFVRRFVNGIYNGLAKHSLEFERFRNVDAGRGLTVKERTPNHLNPIRTDLAKRVGFDPRLDAFEDNNYAEAIRPLLTTQVFIAEPLYDYYWVRQ